MEIRDLVAIAWKRRWLVLLIVVLAAASSTAFALTRTPEYESTATLAVTADADELQTPIAEDALSALLGTYAQTAQSGSNLEAAEEVLGRPISSAAITTSTEAGTGILRISARDSDPEEAARVATAVTTAFERSVGDNPILVTDVVGEPGPALTPVQPRPPLIIAVGTLMGIALAIVVAVALEYFRRRIETSADVTELVNLPVVGRLPRQRELANNPAQVVWGSHEMTGMQETLRALRTNLEFLTDSSRPAIQVTSPFAGEGKSTLVANLGIAFAQIGVRTMVVDCDLRRPTQHKILGVENDRGVSNLLAVPDARVEPKETRFPLLSVIPSGPLPPNSTELLHIRFRNVLQSLRATGCLLVIDTPPLLPVSDARLVAPTVDGVLMILTAGIRRPADLKSAVQSLEMVSARVFGVVLNRSGESVEGREEYGYYYGTRNGDEPAGERRKRRVKTPS